MKYTRQRQSVRLIIMKFENSTDLVDSLKGF